MNNSVVMSSTKICMINIVEYFFYNCLKNRCMPLRELTRIFLSQEHTSKWKRKHNVEKLRDITLEHNPTRTADK